MKPQALIFAALLTGCNKSYYLSNFQANQPTLKVTNLWVTLHVDSDKDMLKISVKNTTNESVFIKWDKAKVKIGDNEPVGTKVFPNYKISVLENPREKAVFTIVPRTDNFRLVPAEELKDITLPVIIGFEICQGKMNQGYSPAKCKPGGSGWQKYILKSDLQLLPSSEVESL